MLDFQMKGEATARHVAQVQMKCTEIGIPKSLGKHLATYLKTAEDLDTKLAEQIKTSFDVCKMNGLTPDEAEAAIIKAIEGAKAAASDANEGEAGDVDPADPEGLLAQLVMQVREKRDLVSTPRNTPRPGQFQRHGLSPRDNNVAMHVDAMQARLDRKHVPTMGRHLAGLSLGEAAMAFVRAEGQRPLNMRDGVRMAMHTGSDFPKVLEGALGNTVARDVLAVQPALMRAAHEVEATDYRLGKLLGLSGSGMPQEVTEGGEIKHVTIDDSGEAKPAPRDFAAIFRISNKAIINDDLGLFDQIGKKMVAGATERQRRVLVEPLLAGAGLGHVMADDKTVFHADRDNLATSGAVLSVATLSAARLALRSQRGKQGEYFAIEPWALVVPPALETAAQQVLAEINATKTSDTNPFAGSLEIIVEVALTDPKAWYLIGNPATSDGLAFAFLDGQSAPRVESKQGWETLGTEFRLVWALDARFVSSASWFKNPGQ